MSVGERMRKWRSFRRMTMPQLSEATGIPASTIYLWEKNRLVPTRQEIGAVAHALGISVSEITGTSRDKAPAKPQNAEAEAATPPSEDQTEQHSARSGGTFDMMLITEIYHYIRDEIDNASMIELTTARNLFQESLKTIKERIKELNDYKKATGQK